MERMSTTTNNTMAHYFKPLKGQYISFKYMITETSLFDNPGFYDHQSPWYRFDKKYGLMLFLLVISAVIAWWVFLWILIGYAVFLFIHSKIFSANGSIKHGVIIL